MKSPYLYRLLSSAAVLAFTLVIAPAALAQDCGECDQDYDAQEKEWSHTFGVDFWPAECGIFGCHDGYWAPTHCNSHGHGICMHQAPVPDDNAAAALNLPLDEYFDAAETDEIGLLSKALASLPDVFGLSEAGTALVVRSACSSELMAVIPLSERAAVALTQTN